MKLADYVIEYLADLGTKHVFMLYGSAIADLVDAFTRTDRIRYVAVMHEQAGAFAAETLTKVSGQIGVTLVTSGPGGTNILTGVANCWYDSVPNIFLTGQITTQFLRKHPSIRQVGFQENDIVSMVKPITKYATMVRDPQKIKWVLDKAVYEATHGRPGPVLIDIPMDVQRVDIDPDTLKGYVGKDHTADYREGLSENIALFLDKLNQSERPVMLVGGGVKLAGAAEEVRELGRLLKIPCLPTWNAEDVITSDYEYHRGRIGTYGGPGRNFCVQNADLLLTIGNRNSGRMTGGVPSSFARGAMKFFVDVDKTSLNPELQEVIGDVNIYCDAKIFANAMIDEVKKREIKPFPWWLDKTQEWLDKYDCVLPEYYDVVGTVNPYVFIRELSDQLGPDDVIVGDHGGVTVVISQAFRTKHGQIRCYSNGNAPMGYAFAGAIGACFADIKGQVISVIGDGGFNLNIQELQTLNTYHLPLKTFIMNNRVYGMTKAYQATNFGGRYEASGPKGYNPPDFVKIAQAYGIEAITINDHSELKSKIKTVLKHEGPVVCDVSMHEHITYEPRIFGWNTPIEDMYPYLPREEFLSNMYIEPLPGWENPIMPQVVRESME